MTPFRFRSFLRFTTMSSYAFIHATLVSYKTLPSYHYVKPFSDTSIVFILMVKPLTPAGNLNRLLELATTVFHLHKIVRFSFTRMISSQLPKSSTGPYVILQYTVKYRCQKLRRPTCKGGYLASS